MDILSLNHFLIFLGTGMFSALNLACLRTEIILCYDYVSCEQLAEARVYRFSKSTIEKTKNVLYFSCQIKNTMAE